MLGDAVLGESTRAMRDPAAAPEPRRDLTVEVDRLPAHEWDALAAQFADVTYDQTAVWSDAAWGEARNSHLVLRGPAGILGCARVVLIAPPLSRSGLAYVKFGPLWRRRDIAVDTATFTALLEALVAEYCDRRGCLLTVLPAPHPDFTRIEEGLLSARGFQVRRPWNDPHRYLADVQLDADAQMASFSKSWRHNLRKALANDIDVTIEDGEEAIAAFTAMHAEMVARKGFRNLDAVERLPDMARHLPEALRPRIALARHAGRVVAGTALGEMGDVAHGLFGASSDEALPLNAGYALRWHILGWLRGRSARWYDLGGAANDPHLDHFKTGLVGKRGVKLELPGEFDFWTRSRGRLTGDVIYRLRDLQRAVRSWHAARQLKARAA